MEPRTPKSEYTRALDLLTRYLALRDHSRFELRTKLNRRFENEVVEQVMAEAEAHGWMADDELIAQRAALAYQRKMKSEKYIVQQLRKRGLPMVAIDQEKDLENARALVERKFGPAHQLAFADRAAAYQFLQYRGFADQLIRQVFHAEP